MKLDFEGNACANYAEKRIRSRITEGIVVSARLNFGLFSFRAQAGLLERVRLGHIPGWSDGRPFQTTRIVTSVTALYPAQKQFFLRRFKAHFRASHFSMLICQPALSRLIADRPKENAGRNVAL